MKSVIYLIRHGITEGNLKRWHYGRVDIPLAQEGIENLKKLADEKIYPNPEDGNFYTSGMLRTEQTFEIIFGGREHNVIEELKEMNFGEFEKKTYDEIKDDERYRLWVGDMEGNVRIPGGESKQEFFQRVGKGFEKLVALHRLKELAHRHDKKDAISAVVCHGGVISCIMMSQFDSDISNFVEWIPDPGRGYAIEMEDGKCISYSRI